MFYVPDLTLRNHRRHADRIAELWLQRLKDSSSNKRLNLVYLANEVVQQSKARRKDDFTNAFSPIIAEATATAYRGATTEVQNKLRRVVEVWKQRQIFDTPVQEAIEARIDELDKSRSSSKRSALGGSLFSSTSSVPPELQQVATQQVALSKANATTASAVPTAESEYIKLTDPEKPIPTPPVYAARLSALLRSLSAAETAVSASLKARRTLLTGLESLVEENKAALTKEETQHTSFNERKTAIEAKKREVEDGIMRGMSAENSPVTPHHASSDPRTNGRASATPIANTDPDRPDVEELTPPPEPAPSAAPVDVEDDYEPSPAATSGYIEPTHTPQPTAQHAQLGADLLSSLNLPPVRQYSGSPQGSDPKRRKLNDEESAVFEGADAMADLDEDVAELLRQESGGR